MSKIRVNTNNSKLVNDKLFINLSKLDSLKNTKEKMLMMLVV